MDQTFLLDSNIFIESENIRYPHDVFPGIWEWFGYYAKQGVFKSIDKVYDELMKSKDYVSSWAEEHRFMFQESGCYESKYIGQMTEILVAANCPERHLRGFVGNPSYADPFLIAYAKAHDLILVTNEIAINNNFQGRVKIPDMCRELEVQYIDLTQLLKQTEDTFYLSKKDR